jgi:hypothetical protein
MNWITRERRKIDRIACPWLILRFIDAQAQFHYVPADQVLGVAQQIGAIPYDIPGVELSHVGERCSFDAFLKKYQLDDPALSRLNLGPQSAGLYAISLGLSATLADDLEMLRHGLVMCDAPCAWCAKLQNETHAWPPAGYSLAT